MVDFVDMANPVQEGDLAHDIAFDKDESLVLEDGGFGRQEIVDANDFYGGIFEHL